MRYLGTLTVALTCAFGLAVSAQETTTAKTKIKSNAPHMVTYTGCVANGSETTTYMLNNVVPVTRTVERRGTSGTISTTTTSYVLVPGSNTVTFTSLVGHKVEVTGVMIPAGKDVKTRSKTKIEREGAPDVKIEEHSKTDTTTMPHFRVVSVKQLSEPCNPE